MEYEGEDEEGAGTEKMEMRKKFEGIETFLWRNKRGMSMYPSLEFHLNEKS